MYRKRKGRFSFSVGKKGPRASYRLGCLLPFLVALGVMACSGSGGQAAQSPCERAVQAAAAGDEMADTVEDLDPAITACPTLAEIEAASAKYPAAFDGADVREFVANRCLYSSTLKSASICSEVQ
jgi:hypothetical protein